MTPEEKIKFHLDLSDENIWLIIPNIGGKFFAGKDKGIAMDLVKRLNECHRPAMSQRADDINKLSINWNTHEIWESPKWEVFNFGDREEVLFAKWLLEYALILDEAPKYRVFNDRKQPESLNEWYEIFLKKQAAMTPEEKQAIIDKAKGLGFRYYPSGKSLFKNLINGSILIFWVEDLELRISKDMSDSPIKTISSPSDLETLFNAIVS